MWILGCRKALPAAISDLDLLSMVEKLVLCVPTELKIIGFVVDLISSNTKIEVTWSVLIYVHFYYSGLTFYRIFSILSWVISFIIYVH